MIDVGFTSMDEVTDFRFTLWDIPFHKELFTVWVFLFAITFLCEGTVMAHSCRGEGLDIEGPPCTKELTF